MKTKVAKSQREIRIRGKRVPPFGDQLVLVRTPSGVRSAEPKQRPSSETRVLIKKVGSALNNPGIKPKAVFKGGSTRVFAYSVDPKNPDRIVRKSAAGVRTIGRVKNGRFKAG